MPNSTHCVNTSCWCSVRLIGDACCADCELDSKRAIAGACGCGHADCEPRGLELDDADYVQQEAPTERQEPAPV